MRFVASLWLTSANFFLIGDLGVEIATVGVVHHNAQASLVHKRLFVRDDIGMSHSFEHMNLGMKARRC